MRIPYDQPAKFAHLLAGFVLVAEGISRKEAELLYSTAYLESSADSRKAIALAIDNFHLGEL